MDAFTRRELGTKVLGLAGMLGLRTITPSTVLTAGAPLAAGVMAGCRPDATAGALRQPAGKTQAFRHRPECVTQTGTEVVIVGSGYGSAVTALRLTERGIPVTMLEMGRIWEESGPDGKRFCGVLNPDRRAMWFKTRTQAVVKNIGPISTSFEVPLSAGIMDVRGNEDMEVYCGRGLGGGSLVNLAIYVVPEREVFERTLPEVDSDEMFFRYYPQALSALRASQVPYDLVANADVYQYARTGANAAAFAGIRSSLCTSGYDYEYMVRELAGEVPASATIGEGGFGNNYGKRSLDQTYLAEAMGTGLLTILTLHEATRIRPLSSGHYQVDCREIDLDGNVLAEPTLECSHLFLGGGSMGTSEILVRARDSGDLPDLNAEVGTAWGPNSDIFVARAMPLSMPTGTINCTVPATAFNTRDMDDRAVFSMFIPLPIGIESFTGFNIVMTENPEAGRFEYDSTSGEVRLNWHVSQNEPAVRASRFVFDKINAACGSTYNGDLFGGPELGDRATYHPVGGCPLGSATDSYGRLAPYRGLYVMDGSLIPVGIGANPALTITALAERNIARILEEDFGC